MNTAEIIREQVREARSAGMIDELNETITIFFTICQLTLGSEQREWVTREELANIHELPLLRVVKIVGTLQPLLRMNRDFAFQLNDKGLETANEVLDILQGREEHPEDGN